MKKAWLLSLLVHALALAAMLGKPITVVRTVAHSAQSGVEVELRARAVKLTATKVHREPEAKASAQPPQTLEAPVLEEFRPAPVYPDEALEQGWEGSIVIEVETDLSGDVRGAEIVQPSGHKILDQQALLTVKRWRLRPLAKLRVPFDFRIRRD